MSIQTLDKETMKKRIISKCKHTIGLSIHNEKEFDKEIKTTADYIRICEFIGIKPIYK